jgi:aminoglycoside 6-adenylyltransferase
VEYDNAIDTLIAWARNSENVRAMVMTGSAAAHETHPLSDRDIEIYATDPTPLLADDSWWNVVDSARALRASIALFARLGRRLADGLGFRSFNHDRVHREVEVILATQSGAR